MADQTDFEAELRAIERLGWSVDDVHLAALHYGDIGPREDVATHLRTGDHLPPEKKAFIAAALRDAELDGRGSDGANTTTTTADVAETFSPAPRAADEPVTPRAGDGPQRDGERISPGVR